jgi:hypothetical protein
MGSSGLAPGAFVAFSWFGPARHFAPGTDRDEIFWIGSRGRRADHGGNDDRDSYDKPAPREA